MREREKEKQKGDDEMMKTKIQKEKTIATWTLGGKKAALIHVLREESLADHNFLVDCDKVRLVVDGRWYVYQGLDIDTNYGDIIRVMGGKVRIADDVHDIVVAFLRAHDQQIAQQIAQQKINPPKHGIGWCDNCHSYCFGDCEAS